MVVVRTVRFLCDDVVTAVIAYAHRNPLYCQSNGTYLILFGLHLAKEINNHLLQRVAASAAHRTREEASNFSFAPLSMVVQLFLCLCVTSRFWCHN